MAHLLQKSKCSIFHNIFKYIILQMGVIIEYLGLNQINVHIIIFVSVPWL